MTRDSYARFVWVTALLVFLAPQVAKASADGCFVFCAPELNLEPTLTIENLFAPPRVVDLATGEERREDRELAYELALVLDVPTELSFLGLGVETIFPLGEDNAPEFEAEAKFIPPLKTWTRGWLGAHFDLVMKLSPRERPGDSSAYTPKLNLELDVSLYAFKWLREGRYLRDLSIEASLDYVATGLPGAGDVWDGQRYVDPASPWSLSLLLAIPIAPLLR